MLPDPLKDVAGRLERTADELANLITHGVGLALSVFGAIVLVAIAVHYGPVRVVVGTAVFAASLVLLYAASTCYHAACHAVRKRRLRTLDQIAILYLIAGTYTPLALIGLGGPWGWTMLALIWALALTGTIYRLVAPAHFERGGMWLYLAMGWLVVLFSPVILGAVPTSTVALLAAGGLLYCVGIVFFLRDRPRYDHALWHVFVMGGSGCHYAAVALLIVP
jgi:hemolysin III